MHGTPMRRWIAFAMLVLPELEVPFKIMTLALISYSFYATWVTRRNRVTADYTDSTDDCSRGGRL